MESKFNINRISNLFKYELVLLQQPLLLSVVGFALFIIAICALSSTLEPRGVVTHQTLGTIYGLAIGLGGPIISSFSFHRIATKGGALNYLSLPASREEKFFVTFLSTAFFYPITVTLVFLVVELGAKLVWSLFGGSIFLFTVNDMISAEGLLGFTMSYLFVHSFYFLGSSLFRRYAFLKTTVIGFGLFVGFWVVGVIVFLLFFSNGQFENMDYSLQLDEETLQGTIKYVFQVGVSFTILALWILSFLKFKRAEV
ncbi:hypothetical protein [Flammeovirga agarivorans]|uniref:ABC-2 family transporter protein n=1 Tax=Flammeovirga agarivorans TaxID=2726742 RepID=A0A7X8SIH7_9BACT|nr:hypothetical protein [Flammeovirga agarivorans]NLR90839.1 hypothetical protein [Flammeovirga agarivorans]